MPAPWASGEWQTDHEWVWRSAAADPPERLYALWRNAVGRSRSVVTRALAERGLGGTFKDTGGRVQSLRRLLADMVEEYARHAGHADLIRESVDGLAGEAPGAAVRLRGSLMAGFGLGGGRNVFSPVCV